MVRKRKESKTCSARGTASGFLVEVAEPTPGHPILQYCRAIASIRKKLRKAGDRERIENKTEYVRGQVHGSYRIVLTSDILGITPANPKPLKTWEQVCAERDEKTRKPEPEWSLTP